MSIFEIYIKEDQPFVIHSQNYVSGLCYFVEICGNLLVVEELGQDLRERVVFYNLDKVEKIVGVYEGDVDFVEVDDKEPSEFYIS